MRELLGEDIFAMSEIFDKMDIKLEKQETMDMVMVDIMKKALQKLHLAKVEVRRFLADLEGKSEEEIQELSISEYLKLFNEFKNKAGITDFLKSALDVSKSNS